jgi:hypothetical protein
MATTQAKKAIGDLLEKYAAVKPSERELEIRFKGITRDIFTTICAGVKAVTVAASLDCSLNTISKNIYNKLNGQDDASYIRRMQFNDGIITTDTYYVKKRLDRLIKVNDYIPYSVGLSSEVPLKSFSASVDALVRFKTRFSAQIENTPWRIDMTAVRQCPLVSLQGSMRRIRDALFGGLTADNYCDKLDHSEVTSYEVELEYTGDRAPVLADFAVVEAIFAIVNPSYHEEQRYQEVIYEVARLITPDHADKFTRPSYRLKQLANQAISLTKLVYYNDVYPADGYLMTAKADGERALVYIKEGSAKIITSMKVIDRAILGGAGHVDSCVFDAELLSDGRLRIFDVLVLDGINHTAEGLSIRVSHIPSAVDKLQNAFAAEYITIKKDDLEASYKSVLEAKYDYPTDGLIISEPHASYTKTHNYKWKPLSHNTIDFLAIKCPRKLIGVQPFIDKPNMTLYLLFVGISHNMREKMGLALVRSYNDMFQEPSAGYYPVQFSPSADPLAYLYWHNDDSLEQSSHDFANLDRKIIELSRESCDWRFHRVREDRKMEANYYGNDYRTAELTFNNYIDIFTEEDLWNRAKSYFTEQSSSTIYTAGNKYRRFVISLLMRELLSGAKWVIDEAAGRGADLHRYQEIRVSNALFIDIDKAAITELIRRKFAFTAGHTMKKWTGGTSGLDESTKPPKTMTIHTLVADLKNNYKELVSASLRYGAGVGIVDGIVCNFALHYFCDSVQNMRNLLLYNAVMLKIGGLFIFTVMDGAAIFKLLEDVPTGQQWISREHEVIKYAISKLYSGNKLGAAGQMISVKLPFSDDMYEEPLCNVDKVISEAKSIGLALEHNNVMTHYLNEFARADKYLSAKLSEDDRMYSGLFRYVVLRKVKEPPAK